MRRIRQTRTQANADAFLEAAGRLRHQADVRVRRLRRRKLRRYSHRRAHRGPGAAGDARRAHEGAEGDRRLRQAAGLRRRRPAHRLCAARSLDAAVSAKSSPSPATCAITARATARRCTWKPGRKRPTTCCAFIHDVEREQPVHQLRSGQHDPLRHGRADRRAEEGRPVCAERALQGRQMGQESGQGMGPGSGARRKATSAWKTICGRSRKSATTAR